MTKVCIVCDGFFEARSNAKTCSDACRTKLSRRTRDPEIGSAERRERQREGLDKRFLYPEIQRDLRRSGLVPTQAGPTDPDGNLLEKSAQFDLTPKYEWRRRETSLSALWSPSDGWWRDDTIPTLAKRQDAYLAAEARRRQGGDDWRSPRGFYDRDGTYYADSSYRWVVIDGSPWPVPNTEPPPGWLLPREEWLKRFSETELADGAKLRLLTVTQRIGRKDEMIAAVPKDEQLAEDAELLVGIALRLQARFPSSRVLQEAVNTLISDTQPPQAEN